jgi:hypothetical protein
MDKKEFRFSRHLKKWEEQTKAIKRVSIAGIFFSFLLLLKVFHPFVGISEEKSVKTKDIKDLRQEQGETEALINELNKFKQTLGTVQERIRSEPWMREKERLIITLASIRQNRPESQRWEEYQKAADATISTISQQETGMIIKPLVQALNRNPELKNTLPGLSQALEDTRVSIKEFEEDHLGKRWYETLVMKQIEIKDLTASLQDRMIYISGLIDSEQIKIASKRKELKNREELLETNILEKQSSLERLELEMQEILPEWLRGLFSIELMIQLFPLLLVCIVVYVIGTARALSNHHSFITDTVGFSELERNDPSTSSIWTLTNKGRYGTVLTLMTYISLTFAIWVFFEWGCFLLSKWLETNNQAAWISSKGRLTAIIWIGRILFIAALSFIVSYPIYFKNRIFRDSQ